MAFLFDKVKQAVSDVETKMKASTSSGPTHSHTHADSAECSDNDSHHMHRYQSFAPQREGNEVKWFVDGW
jgi:phospholipase D1/2